MRRAPSPTTLADSAPRHAERERRAHEPGRTSENEHYERFLLATDESLAAGARTILRGAGPDPEKVALLRAVYERGPERAAELYLLALRELPDVSARHGESVPSTALLLLDRRAAQDERARAILRRVAFEAPLPAPNLRRRAAASYLLHATGSELYACRSELTREADPRFLECALEALSRNPHSDAAAILLAAHGRSPAEPIVDRRERP